jgi:tetratricopeptide (TPR) repeat protein
VKTGHAWRAIFHQAALTAVFGCCGWAQIPRLDAPITTDYRIRLYEQWLASDPHDISIRDRLAAAYIQKTRETSDFGYVDRASKIVDQILSERRDYEALRLRNLIELNRHNFSKVAEYATDMTKGAPLDPQNWGTLGDALMEMGRYDEARDAFQQMLTLRRSLFSLNRMAYYRFVTGDTDGAVAMMTEAVEAGAPYPENKAWCLVELGNMYFKTGRWSDAERAFRQAIDLFPASHTAFAALGSVQAAQGRSAQAIESYSKAQSITPMPQYAAALHDLFLMYGRRAEAQRQSDMIDLVAQLEAASNFKANRTLALIFANQDRKLTEALDLAQTDLAVRKDIYTYDAYAWALFKNKRYQDAQSASQEALKIGTPEALFYYHAGMIAQALGDETRAKSYLQKALQLNQGFDIRQGAIARTTLAELSREESKAAGPLHGR